MNDYFKIRFRTIQEEIHTIEAKLGLTKEPFEAIEFECSSIDEKLYKEENKFIGELHIHVSKDTPFSILSKLSTININGYGIYALTEYYKINNYKHYSLVKFVGFSDISDNGIIIDTITENIEESGKEFVIKFNYEQELKSK